MRAADVMTTTVLTVLPRTPVGQVARMLAARGVSGAPVVDEDGRLLGLVTEGDLIRRLAAVTDRPRSWFLSLFASAPAQAAHYARSHGRTAADVMTAKIESVAEDTPLEQVASILERRGIRRVPVLRGGRLVGIVSRADLLKASLDEPRSETVASDAEIGKALTAAIREQPWIDAYWIFPSVRGGVVTFHGFCRAPEVQRALIVLAEGIPGVQDVRVITEPTPRFLLAT